MEGFYYSKHNSWPSDVNGVQMTDSDIDKVYKDFWKEIVTTDGKLDLEKVKAELFDYSFMLEQVPKVYCEVTGNSISKPNTYADSVISCFNDHIQTLINDEIENNAESLSHLEPQLDALNKEIDNLRETLKEKNNRINELLRKLNAKYTVISSNKKL